MILCAHASHSLRTHLRVSPTETSNVESVNDITTVSMCKELVCEWPVKQAIIQGDMQNQRIAQQIRIGMHRGTRLPTCHHVDD